MRAGDIRPVSPPRSSDGGIPEPDALDSDPGIPYDSHDAQFDAVERLPTELIYAEDAWAPRGGPRNATVLGAPTNTAPPPPNVCLINANADWMGGCELEIEDAHAPCRLHWSAVSE